MKVLVVEDERKLGQFVRKGLEEAAYSVTLVSDCKTARDALCESEYDVIILDLGLPDGSGLDLLREWRESRFANHILILSARGSVDDRVKGLNLGADDYLAKPFSFGELLARVRSLGRRQARQRTTVLQHGTLRMDLVSREVTVNGKAVYLTQREYSLLEIFLQNVGRVLTRTQIAEKIWDCHFDMETNLIDVYVRKLRGKLGTESNSPISTIRGVGYSMT
ncbi:MAG: response regulator transcription factor [Limisphaerales bacterium]